MIHLQRSYIFTILGFAAANFHVKILQTNLMKMLVTKINQLQNTMDIKDIYNASMIHELRNPLNAVLGSIGLLKYSQSLNQEDHETLNIASVSGEILITLINNALDGAKLEANKLELDPHMIDIVEILTKSVSLFQWKAKEKKINFTLKIAKTIPDQVEIDEARLVQLLVNLIGNAVKFTPNNGKVKVRVNFLRDKGIYQSNNLIGSYTQKNIDLFSDEENEEEYEQRHFYNKEIIVDMQGSEDISPAYN